MTRLLLPATALVLVVTACGAGAQPAPRLAPTGANVPSVSVTAEWRKKEARRESKLLLREFVPPPGARTTREPQRYGGVLRRYGPAPLGEVVDVHHFWSVRKPLAAVAAFVRTHRPPGFRDSGGTYGSNVPHYLMWSFSSSSRYLDVTAVALPGRTELRVDALALWIYPRSPSERIPPATREIVVTAPERSTKVTDPVKIAEIRRWFDALPVSPPGIVVACPLEIGPDITVSFRNAAGKWLAQAKLPSRVASICDAIAFQIGGKTEKPLIDRNVRDSFVRRLQGLLGVRLVEPVLPRHGRVPGVHQQHRLPAPGTAQTATVHWRATR